MSYARAGNNQAAAHLPYTTYLIRQTKTSKRNHCRNSYGIKSFKPLRDNGSLNAKGGVARACNRCADTLISVEPHQYSETGKLCLVDIAGVSKLFFFLVFHIMCFGADVAIDFFL